jgi:hypothetical protein
VVQRVAISEQALLTIEIAHYRILEEVVTAAV